MDFDLLIMIALAMDEYVQRDIARQRAKAAAQQEISTMLRLVKSKKHG